MVNNDDNLRMPRYAITLQFRGPPPTFTSSVPAAGQGTITLQFRGPAYGLIALMVECGSTITLQFRGPPPTRKIVDKYPFTVPLHYSSGDPRLQV